MKLTPFIFAALLPVSVLAEGKPGSHFIENWDMNGDGTVALEELTERRSDVFFTFDSDENGFLNAEEYGYFDNARAADMEGKDDHAQGKMGKVQAGMIMTFNDANGDGQVSRAEFLTKAADWLAMIDRDGSGNITEADFGPRG